MKRLRFWMTGGLAVVMAAVSGDLVREPSTSGSTARYSQYDADETLRKLETAARGHGYTIFARLAATSAAAEAGRSMALVLGVPEGGTPVMVDEAAASIEVPLALTIVARPDGRTEVRVPGEPGLPISGLVPLSRLVDSALS
ncbi:hypothetical protein M8A51_21015 [Schlegelella sp. S2-27]|uniref:DUF302 domain-containing protein n=1 Tax=Caldimonas mangrovi TaxID=2944811 RepID=A0ABT0YTF1_9BURK|nr:hypothetical protein [Caldimonas mangrovi]MCM5682017.1 hypothetical protein [Caldimonas mangrovi]